MSESSLTPYKSEILPNIGAKGIYELATPFNSKIIANLEYVCTGVETINSMMARGVDVLQDIYIANSVEASVFNTDSGNNRSIITIQPTEGVQIRFPSSFLLGWPNNNMVRYAELILCCSLSVIPDTEDLTTLKQEVADMVLSRTGIRNEVKIFRTSSTYLVSRAQHNAAVEARKNRITENKSTANKLRDALDENQDLKLRLSRLENYIKDNYPPT